MLSRLALVAATLALGGCWGGYSTSRIDLRDESTVVPAVRASLDFGERPGPRSVPHTSHAIEFGVSGATGDDNFRLDAGQLPVRFGGETFVGPQEMRAEYDFRFVEVAYRFRLVSERSRLGIEALGGLGHARLGLRLFGTTQIAAERLDGTGVVFSVGPMLRLWSSGTLSLRGSGFVSTTSEGVSSLTRYEIALEQALGRHAALRGGYTQLTVRSEREDDEFSASNRSPIFLRARGPFLGLVLAF